MIATNSVGKDVDDAFLLNELQWIDRMLPEVEWDANDALRLVEDIVGRSRTSVYN